MVATAPGMRFTASLPSGPGEADDGGSPSTCGKVCPLVNGNAALGEDDPGRALDEFLGAAHSECRVIGDVPLGPVELLTDSGGVLHATGAPDRPVLRLATLVG